MNSHAVFFINTHAHLNTGVLCCVLLLIIDFKFWINGLREMSPEQRICCFEMIRSCRNCQEDFLSYNLLLYPGECVRL